MLLLCVALVACRAPAGSAPAASGSAATSPSATGGLVSSTPSPSPSPLVGLPEPGRPYVAADVRDAMAASNRPGGVPAELQTDAIAGAVAGELWTFDGDPWEAMVAGGSCGPDHCTLEISGSVAGAAAEDHYLLEVTPADASVRVTGSELRALPQALIDELDQLARDLWPTAPLPGPLASARWLAPPDADRFVLSYRSGGEEGSPATDAVLDVRAGTVELYEPGTGP
jgi:hypothetical protein